MQRKRYGLVPIGEAVSGLGGPVKELRETPPQAVHQRVMVWAFHRSFQTILLSFRPGEGMTSLPGCRKLIGISCPRNF